MPMMALQFLGSKLGAWVIVGILVLALGATWKVQQWRIEARDGQIAALGAQLDQAVDANKRYKATLDEVTASLEAAKLRADNAIKGLTAARARAEVRIENIRREVQNAATPADDAPATPSTRSALRGLRDAFPSHDPRAPAR